MWGWWLTCVRCRRWKDHKDVFKRLKKYLEGEKWIRDKDKVYRIDTEIDRIMTCFKISFINLCSLFLARCMDREKVTTQASDTTLSD
ncbi:MAG: hypothetical protein C5S48_09655 [Candidatus Methanogaster sp.]|nr:MAG: hypothetical protein C5S48_09655 [ANME-2 cluster archaeon]